MSDCPPEENDNNDAATDIVKVSWKKMPVGEMYQDAHGDIWVVQSTCHVKLDRDKPWQMIDGNIYIQS